MEMLITEEYVADLSDKQVAIIVHNYFEQAELEEPKKALEEAGATVHILAPEAGEVTGVNGDINKGDSFTVDKTLDEAIGEDYDALVIPGGTVNADKLRMNQIARDWVTSFVAAEKPVAVICHGPWRLVSSGLAEDRQLASYYTLQDDINNAGGEWVDEEVVIDGPIITSRNPDDLPAFNAELIAALE